MKMWKGGETRNARVGAWFDVKIQTGGTTVAPMLLYNEERDFTVRIMGSNCSRFTDLYRAISQFQPCSGRKAYFRAKLCEGGDKLFVAGEQVFVRKW